MKVITLRVPKPFSDDVNSWPEGLKQDGMSQVVVIGQANGGLDLCELIVGDDWDITAIPSGWRATSAHIRSGGSLTAEQATNTADYLKHIPDTILYDEDGNQIGATPAVYHRIHKFQGWPDVAD